MPRAYTTACTSIKIGCLILRFAQLMWVCLLVWCRASDQAAAIATTIPEKLIVSDSSLRSGNYWWAQNDDGAWKKENHSDPDGPTRGFGVASGSRSRFAFQATTCDRCCWTWIQTELSSSGGEQASCTSAAGASTTTSGTCGRRASSSREVKLHWCLGRSESSVRLHCPGCSAGMRRQRCSTQRGRYGQVGVGAEAVLAVLRHARGPTLT